MGAGLRRAVRPRGHHSPRDGVELSRMGCLAMADLSRTSPDGCAAGRTAGCRIGDGTVRRRRRRCGACPRRPSVAAGTCATHPAYAREHRCATRHGNSSEPGKTVDHQTVSGATGTRCQHELDSIEHPAGVRRAGPTIRACAEVRGSMSAHSSSLGSSCRKSSLRPYFAWVAPVQAMVSVRSRVTMMRMTVTTTNCPGTRLHSLSAVIAAITASTNACRP